MKKILNKEVGIKELLIIIPLIPVLFIFVLVSLAIIIGMINSILPMHYKDKMILKGYYEKDEHFQKSGFQDHTDHCKYFYKKLDDDKFKNNIKYIKIEEDDIDFIKGYFKDTQKWININANLDDFDFDYEAITMGDYYYLDLKESGYNNYNLYFYDVENHVLYYIHSNI